MGYSSVDLNRTIPPAVDRTQSILIIKPKVGYYFNDKWSAGLYFNYSNKKLKYKDVPDVAAATDSSFKQYGISPYVRYNCVSKGDFSFGFEGSFDFTKSKESYLYTDLKDIETARHEYGLSLNPVFSYGLSRHWILEATLDLFSIHYYTADTKETYKDIKYTSKENGFITGLDGFGDWFDKINIGIVYKF